LLNSAKALIFATLNTIYYLEFPQKIDRSKPFLKIQGQSIDWFAKRGFEEIIPQ
jgi:hypothetical protein